MKKVVLLVLVSLLLFTIACSDDGCENQNPTVKLVNNGTGKADIQIKTSNGNTENINNIEPGTSSARRSFAPGDIEFTISIQGKADPVVYMLTTLFCNDYTVTINEDNTVTSSGIKLEKETLL